MTQSRQPAARRVHRMLVMSLCALPALVASHAIAQRTFDRPPVVKEGTTVRISPYVYVIPDEGARGVPNVGIIVGSRATLVIDPGMGLKSGEAVMREAAKVSRGSDLYIVNTHFHPEHTTGEAAFPASAKIIRAAAQQQDIEEMGLKWVEIFSKRSAELSDLLKDIKGFRAPAEIFERDKVLDLGGERVRLMRLGPAHTRGDTAIFVEGEDVPFSGDLAMRKAFPAFATPQSRADTWITSLDALDALRPSRVVGAHYGMGDASIITAYREVFTALRARVADEAAGEIVRRNRHHPAQRIPRQVSGLGPAAAGARRGSGDLCGVAVKSDAMSRLGVLPTSQRSKGAIAPR